MTKQGASDGVICYQHGDELWYNVPASKEHEKHGYVGDRPSGSNSRVLKGKDIVHIDGFEGKIDQVGGGWQNACYKVTLGAGHPTPPPPENRIKFLGVWKDTGNRGGRMGGNRIGKNSDGIRKGFK